VREVRGQACERTQARSCATHSRARERNVSHHHPQTANLGTAHQSESLCVACVYWGRDETPRRKSRRAHFLIIPNYKSARSGRAHARQLDTQLPGPTHVTRPCTLPCTALTAQNCPLRRSLPATSKARTTLSSSSSVPSPPARPIAGRHRGSPSIPWPAG